MSPTSYRTAPPRVMSYRKAAPAGPFRNYQCNTRPADRKGLGWGFICDSPADIPEHDQFFRPARSGPVRDGRSPIARVHHRQQTRFAGEGVHDENTADEHEQALERTTARASGGWES